MARLGPKGLLGLLVSLDHRGCLERLEGLDLLEKTVRQVHMAPLAPPGPLVCRGPLVYISTGTKPVSRRMRIRLSRRYHRWRTARSIPSAPREISASSSASSRLTAQ